MQMESGDYTTRSRIEANERELMPAFFESGAHSIELMLCLQSLSLRSPGDRSSRAPMLGSARLGV